jgi:hypothetical protein
MGGQARRLIEPIRFSQTPGARVTIHDVLGVKQSTGSQRVGFAIAGFGVVLVSSLVYVMLFPDKARDDAIFDDSRLPEHVKAALEAARSRIEGTPPPT